MDLAPDEQRERKRAIVHEALVRYETARAVEAESVVRAEPELGYRTRLKWMVQGGRLGLYARGGGHRVVDTPECLVASPLLLGIAASIRARLPMAALEAIDLREVDGPDGRRALVTLVVADRAAEADARRLADELRAQHPSIAGVAMNLRGRRNPQVLGRETVRLVGADAVADRVGAAHVLATYGSFAQAHRGQARAIANAVAERVARLGPRPRVLELFGGSGALGFELAARGASVDLVESFAPAAELAQRAAIDQRLALVAHAAEAERYTAEAAARGESYDVVLVDPPRRGLVPGLRSAIARLAPRLVVYVSCQPSTLARDLDHLQMLGFGCDSVAPYDMIPQTEEVEVLAFLESVAPPPLRCLAEEAGVAIVDRPPHLDDRDFGRRATACLSGRDVVVPVSRHAPSGATPVTATTRDAMALATRFLVLAKGVTTSTGEPHGLRYRRLALVGGHSLLALTATEPADALLARLAATGHPAIAGPHCDSATTRHFFEKHGLDRPFVHASAVTVASGSTVRAPLAGDLEAVLASLGFVWNERLVDSDDVRR